MTLPSIQNFGILKR